MTTGQIARYKTGQIKSSQQHLLLCVAAGQLPFFGGLGDLAPGFFRCRAFSELLCNGLGSVAEFTPQTARCVIDSDRA